MGALGPPFIFNFSEKLNHNSATLSHKQTDLVCSQIWRPPFLLLRVKGGELKLREENPRLNHVACRDGMTRDVTEFSKASYRTLSPRVRSSGSTVFNQGREMEHIKMQ